MHQHFMQYADAEMERNMKNINILRDLSYGVYVVSTMDEGRPTGCIANSAMQITSSPATLAVSINHENYTNGCIGRKGMFSISILSEKSDPGLIGTFGFQSGKDVDKYEKVAYEMVEGIPVVKDGCGYLICKVVDRMETATHTIFLGEIMEGDAYESIHAMTYAYYHKVVKGKSPKYAPTYIPDGEIQEQAGVEAERGPVRKWVCQVCGYVHEAGELPEDFVCPICKQGRDKFQPID